MDDTPPLRLVTSASVERSQAAHPATGGRVRCLAEFGEVLTIEEAVSVLRISRGSAYDAARLWRATRTEGLPVIQMGRRLLVPRSALEVVLEHPAQLYADAAASPGDSG